MQELYHLGPSSHPQGEDLAAVMMAEVRRVIAEFLLKEESQAVLVTALLSGTEAHRAREFQQTLLV